MSACILYFSLISLRNHVLCILKYSGSFNYDCKKKSLMSMVINLSPFLFSEITLFTKYIGSNSEATGDEASLQYSKTSPPTVNLTLYFYFLNG